jgi:hypothetical protein
MPSFGGEVKSSVARRSFAACKITLQLPWKSQLKSLRNLSPSYSSVTWQFCSGHMKIMLLFVVSTAASNDISGGNTRGGQLTFSCNFIDVKLTRARLLLWGGGERDLPVCCSSPGIEARTVRPLVKYRCATVCIHCSIC